MARKAISAFLPSSGFGARWRRASLAALWATGTGVAPAHATDARYACSGGTTLLAQFSPPSAPKGRVTLVFGTGEVMTLPQVPSADGGRYEGKGLTFWIKGRDATFTRQGSSETCTTRQ